MKAVSLLSGGLDSVTLLYKLLDDGYNVHALSFDYGQRHKKELTVAMRIAKRLDIPHHVIKLGVYHEGEMAGPLSEVLGGSALTDPEIAVSDGHYAEESMKATVVPNRNAVMLSIAYAVAVAEGRDFVAFGAHAGDHAIYPDCRPDFVYALNRALQLGNLWAEPTPEVGGPFLSFSKAEIAVLAHKLSVPIADTWSCYKAGKIHCGTCGTCYERREALDRAFKQTGIPDPTEYLDSTTTFADPTL